MRPVTLPPLHALVVAGLLAGIVAMGFLLRLDDPLSSPAIGAEDPYTHVVFTKEALERGWFGDSVHLGTSMYPPGIHAFTGAVAPLAGVSLYDFARFAPPVLGAIAVAGVFLLAQRLAGPVAGLVAALVTALMPEHVFRTNLFAPTAFDLALLPAYLLAFHLAVARVDDGRPAWRSPERLGGAALFLVMSVPLAFLHPWAVPLFGAPLAIFAALRAFRGPPSEAAPRVAWATGLLVVATAFAMASRWTQSDTGFADFFQTLPPLAWLGALDLPPMVLFPILLVVFAALAAPMVLLVGWAARARLRLSERTRARAGLGAGLALLATIPFLTSDLAVDVHYWNMLGPVPVLLALAGFLLAAWRPSRLGDLALALAVALFPLTAVNLFDSPYWPQRTVAYLSIGVALLSGVAAIEMHRAARSLAERRARLPLRWAAPVALFVTIGLVGSAMAVAPGKTYAWYRLYPDDQFEGFQETAALLAEDPDARAVVHSWQPGLMLKALADPAQVRYAPSFYKDGAEREEVLAESDGTTYVVVDEFVLDAQKKGKADLSFLDDGRYALLLKSDDGRFRLYEVR